MSDTSTFEKCLTFIDCHMQDPHAPVRVDSKKPRPFVTISRQAGAGGITLANRLAVQLEKRRPAKPAPWTVFGRELLAAVIERHNLPRNFEQFMAEDRVSAITDAVEEILGLHPPTSALVRQVTDTLLHLAELGHVILIGRGGNLVTAHLESGVHVRLVAPLEQRLARIQEVRQLARKKALEFIRKEDAARRRYVRRYFGRDIEDPLQYHLVINTAWIHYDDAATLIADAVLREVG
jgi:cytidylate kinase